MKKPNTACLNCGTTYYRSPSLVKSRIRLTCSRICAARHFRDKGEWVNCQKCGGEMYRTRTIAARGMGKYCSRACEAASRPNPPEERTCKQCGGTFMKDHWSISLGGGLFCSRICTDRFKWKYDRSNRGEKFATWQKREWKDDKCLHCGTAKKLELDHIIPRFAGGKATKENAQTLCRSCNSRKFWDIDYPRYSQLLNV